MNVGLGTITVLACGLIAGSALAQQWPKGPIHLVVPSSPGGGTDIMGRILADHLQKATSAPVVVINQPGGGGMVAFEQVRNAAPDAQTLLINHTGMLVMYHTGRYSQPLADFTTLGVAMSYPPQVYAVNANAPWQTIGDFVDDARANSDQRTIGVSLGGTTHFIAGSMMLNQDISLRLVEAGPEVDKISGIQGGHIDIGNLGAATAQQFVDAGDMRVLCMITPEPDPEYPEFRPCVEEGVDLNWVSPLVVWGPPGIDPDVALAVNEAISSMADDPDTMARLKATNSQFTPHDLDRSQAAIAALDDHIAQLASHLGLAAR
ncbi:Bug family tripartite tricarboxylate transporter substrate binding protein [Roseinatronobacter sp.]|uniref:Bug family tripartite tricarboxylate transporter substrate binding protein n=1 Tax=Roseinatronobacter sp. TaxID=1945755 RepID=UPI003F6EF561